MLEQAISTDAHTIICLPGCKWLMYNQTYEVPGIKYHLIGYYMQPFIWSTLKTQNWCHYSPSYGFDYDSQSLQKQ